MKKQVLVLLVIVIILSTTIQAALPYKETLETNNYKINSVQCSYNKLRVLVESKAEVNLKILFKVYSSKGNINIFSDQLLKRLSADWFDIDTNLACSDLLRLEVNGYAPIENNQNVVYMNTELSYQFTGNEAQILHNIANTTNTSISVPTSPESIMPFYPSSSYVYFNGRLIQSINENNEETYYAQDQIGSNTVLTDSSGNVITKNEYDPFGRDVSSNKGEFKYTGKEQDNSGLYYYGARYYDSSIGRFTQVDPEFKAVESSYSYADNNPLIYNDPTGKDFQLIRSRVNEKDNNNDLDLDSFVRNNIKGIMKNIENKVGISFIPIPPKIVVQTDYCLTNEPAPEQINANYLAKEVLGDPYIFYYFTFVLKDTKTGKTQPFTSIYTKTTAHELGHYYVDMRLRYLNRRAGSTLHVPWMHAQGKQAEANLMIFEGIATYFGDLYPLDTKGIVSEIGFESADNPKNKKELENTYLGGLDITSPIIKKYGSSGIDWMLSNPPKGAELNDMTKYRTRALNSLGK